MQVPKEKTVVSHVVQPLALLEPYLSGVLDVRRRTPSISHENRDLGGSLRSRTQVEYD